MERFVPSAGSIAALERLLDSLRAELHLRLVCLVLETPIPGLPRVVSKSDRSDHFLTYEVAAGLMRSGPIFLDQEDVEFRSFAAAVGHGGGIGYVVALGSGTNFPGAADRTAIEFTAMKATIELLTISHTAELQKIVAESARDKEEPLYRFADSISAEVTVASPEGEIVMVNQIINTIPALAWSAYPDGAAEFINQHYLDYVGLSLEQVQGWGWTSCIHPDDLSNFAARWRSIIKSGRGGETEARIRCFDGQYRWFLIRANPLYDELGEVKRWIGVNIDIDERKTAEVEIRDIQTELAHLTRAMTMGQLTASIVHELNQPLSGILTNAQTSLLMLSGSPPNIDGAKETARRTIRDANRASEIIKRLRTLFRKRPMGSEVIDVNSAASEVILLAATEAQKRNVTVSAELSEGLPQITCDRIQIQQVILNLVLNAIEAVRDIHDRPRQVSIKTSRDGEDQISLSVTDNGPGFAPEDAEALFTPFYTTKSEGMGIGLSVSRTIIRNHCGDIFAESIPGFGATFRITLPVKRAEGASLDDPQCSHFHDDQASIHQLPVGTIHQEA
jgi:PAS domain S-box-containing protein